MTANLAEKVRSRRFNCEKSTAESDCGSTDEAERRTKACQIIVSDVSVAGAVSQIKMYNTGEFLKKFYFTDAESSAYSLRHIVEVKPNVLQDLQLISRTVAFEQHNSVTYGPKVDSERMFHLKGFQGS